MKRILVFCAVLALAFFMETVAFCAEPKPPKAICFSWGDLEDATTLVVKTTGRVTLSTGKTTYYQIGGQHVIPRATPIRVPVSGTGHMEGNLFSFSFTGAASFDGGYGFQTYSLSAEGFWDLVALTGSINYHWSLPTDGTQTIQKMDCTLFTPFGE